MHKAIQKFTIGIVTAVIMVVGVSLAPASGVLKDVGTQKAAACTTSYFKVIWSASGVYSMNTGAYSGYSYKYGAYISAATGQTYGGWTRYVSFPGGFGMMQSASLQYSHCS